MKTENCFALAFLADQIDADKINASPAITNMVAISAVRKANDTLVSRPPGLVSVFVGATKGIGASALRELVKHLKAPKAYVMGRSKANCASQLTELESLNPQATIIFIETDISLLKNVDAVCKDIVSREPKLDLLYMSPGLLAFGGPDCKRSPSSTLRVGS